MIKRVLSGGNMRTERALEVDDEPGVLLFHDGTPDTVVLPPELGGHRQRVKRSFQQNLACPKCGFRHGMPAYELETICVAGCSCGNYLWFRLKAQEVRHEERPKLHHDVVSAAGGDGGSGSTDDPAGS